MKSTLLLLILVFVFMLTVNACELSEEEHEISEKAYTRWRETHNIPELSDEQREIAARVYALWGETLDIFEESEIWYQMYRYNNYMPFIDGGHNPYAFTLHNDPDECRVRRHK
jgi:hypothetical protein